MACTKWRDSRFEWCVNRRPSRLWKTEQVHTTDSWLSMNGLFKQLTNIWLLYFNYPFQSKHHSLPYNYQKRVRNSSIFWWCKQFSSDPTYTTLGIEKQELILLILNSVKFNCQLSIWQNYQIIVVNIFQFLQG